MEIDFLKELNKNSSFLQILSIYNLFSPALNILTPIFLLLMPFIILLIQNKNMILANKEMRAMVGEMIPKIGNNNTTTIHNKFNLNIFV